MLQPVSDGLDDNAHNLNAAADDIDSRYGTVNNDVSRESGGILDAANGVASSADSMAQDAQSIQTQIDAIKSENARCNFN